MRYYGTVPDDLSRPKVQRAKVKWTLTVAVFVATGMFVAVVLVDPFREVRQFHPVQSWGDEALVDRTLPDDMVIFETVHGRVFKFSQNPIEVFSGIGGNVSELSRFLKNDAEESKDPRFENLGFLETFGLPVTLKSGREADFLIFKGKGQYTCKLVIRPLKKLEVGTIFDWLSR